MWLVAVVNINNANIIIIRFGGDSLGVEKLAKQKIRN